MCMQSYIIYKYATSGHIGGLPYDLPVMGDAVHTSLVASLIAGRSYGYQEYADNRDLASVTEACFIHRKRVAFSLYTSLDDFRNHQR
ncbi:hypothetical protein KDK_03070 [Dictyobacter kobayashii]|uniref:Uncharacterized protein n=1 Tax=Dictyobacter kobayashii TaxID=2014872 RepID=A0A402ABP1_9CHLR|nr:hypothetical protein KDK_03070 [Dictyobacter kobayashii]